MPITESEKQTLPSQIQNITRFINIFNDAIREDKLNEKDKHYYMEFVSSYNHEPNNRNMILNHLRNLYRQLLYVRKNLTYDEKREKARQASRDYYYNNLDYCRIQQQSYKYKAYHMNKNKNKLENE